MNRNGEVIVEKPAWFDFGSERIRVSIRFNDHEKLRIASRKVRPALLDRKTAAQYLGVSTEWLRRNVQHVCLPGCEKPLYPVAQLDALVRSADRRKTSGA